MFKCFYSKIPGNAFVMARLQWQICLVYLGDVIVCGRDSDEYQAGLKFKPSKCFLLQPRVPPLGHVISAEGVSTDPANIEASQQWSVPLKFNDVSSFLGLASYYRRFIQNFAEIVAPLDRLTAKTTERFKWSPDCDLAFGGLNEKLVSAPVLAFPCFDQECWPRCTLSSISATTCMGDPSRLGQTTMHLNRFRASRSPKAR